MKKISVLFLIVCSCAAVFAQSALQKVYDTEKAFEKIAAEKGINQAFIEFTAPEGTCFNPNPVNCREMWKNRPPSPAGLFWNPTFVDVSSNGALAYTTGNSIYRPKGKNDENAFYGQYATVWQRQPDGNYLAVLDVGISHEKPATIETEWKSPSETGKKLNERKISSADASTGFFAMAANQGLAQAYKTYLADDARLLREGKFPILGRQNALKEFKKDKSRLYVTKRAQFLSAADMAYTNNSYALYDRNNRQTEVGNFLQVWKFRGGKWQIALDVFLPNPPGAS